MKVMKRAIIKWSFAACLLFSFVGVGNAQNLDLEFSFCSPLTCSDSNFTVFGSAFVQIQGQCFNGEQVEAFAQLTIIIPCTLPVSLTVNAGEEHTPQADECGGFFILGGVFAKGESDNALGPTGTVFSAASCDGGVTDPPPAFNPC